MRGLSFIVVLAALCSKTVDGRNVLQLPQDVDHWEGLDCEMWSLTSKGSIKGSRHGRGEHRQRNGRQLDTSIGPTKVLSSSLKVKSDLLCAKILVPEHTYAKITVSVNKISKSDRLCSQDIVQLRSGWAFEKSTMLEMSCSKKKKIQWTMSPGEDQLNGRKVGFFMRSGDKKSDQITVKIEALPCTTKIAGCTLPLAPTNSPSTSPTERPTTLAPTRSPTESPTLRPTSKPTLSPTLKPTLSPTLQPTGKPTKSPTTGIPCQEVWLNSGSEATITVSELSDQSQVGGGCWKVQIEDEDVFLSMSLDINFPDSPTDCSHQYLGLYDGSNRDATAISGNVCRGQNLYFESSGSEAFVYLHKPMEAFGPGFELRLSTQSEAERVQRTACETEECIRSELQGSAVGRPGHGLDDDEEDPGFTPPIPGSGKPEKGLTEKLSQGKQRINGLMHMTDTSLSSKTRIIEIDSDVLHLLSPIIVPEGITVTLMPKAPRTHVTLDGAREISILVAGPDSKVIIRNIHFTRGFAEGGQGGAITSAGAVDIQNCVFSDNVGDLGGGAIYLYGKKSPSVIDTCRFEYNIAKGGSGGAIVLDNHHATLRQSTFVGNTCDAKGSVAFAQNGRLTFSNDNNFQDNRGNHIIATSGSTLSWLT